MKKKKIFLAGLLSVMILSLSGCANREGEYIKAGFSAIEQSDYQNATDCFQKALDEGENVELAYRGLGLTYLGMAKYDDSIAAFETALSHAGLFAGDLERDINFYMATAYYKGGYLEKAGELFDIIIQSDKDNADAYFLRGAVALESGDYEGGIYNFEKSIEFSKDSQSIKISIFEELAANGYQDKGSEYLTGILDNSTKLSDYEQGVVYFYLQDYENARNHLEVAKQSAGKNSGNIIYMLGKTYEELGDYNYAAVLFTEYLQDNIGDANIYNQLGLCKLKLNDPSSAIKAFESGISLGDVSMMQSLKYNQICAYEQIADFETAKRLISEYLVAYPDDEDARRESVFLSTR